MIKTRGVILKTQDYKENDKLLWMYTEKLGKVSAIAKGAKKRNSKLSASTLVFCFGDYVLYKGRSMYTINEAYVINSFQEFIRDLDTITYCSYINELIDISSIEEEKNFNLFKELITIYYLIKNKVGDIEVLIRAFEIKMLYNTGYSLELGHCVQCGESIKISNYVDLSNFGCICGKCNKQNCIKISNSTYNILRYMIHFPLEKVYRLNLDKNSKKELSLLMQSFILEVYNRKPKSLELFNYINKE